MRLSTQYILAGPKTFRRGSRKILGKWGSNCQNYEKGMREIIIPDGYKIELAGRCRYWLETGDTNVFTDEELDKLRVLVQRDQAGAEALIVAYDCEAGDYRQLFIHDVKPHVYVALKLFSHIWLDKMKESGGLAFNLDEILDTPIAKLKLNPSWKDLDELIKSSDDWSLTERYYYFAKQTCHSANYGIEWSTFQMNILEKSGGKIMIPKQQCKDFLETYRSLFPEIPESNRRIREQVDKYKILYNFFGHPYQITNYNITESTYKEYYAWPRQSTVAEITRIAVSEYQYWIEDNKKEWDFLQDNHDSFMTQCRLTEVKDNINMMGQFLDQELVSPIDGIKFRMKSDYGVGFNWSPYKKDKNELGLRKLKWI